MAEADGAHRHQYLEGLIGQLAVAVEALAASEEKDARARGDAGLTEAVQAARQMGRAVRDELVRSALPRDTSHLG